MTKEDLIKVVIGVLVVIFIIAFLSNTNLSISGLLGYIIFIAFIVLIFWKISKENKNKARRKGDDEKTSPY